MVNPLGFKSDQHQISFWRYQYDIINRKGYEKLEVNFCIFIKFSQQSLRKCTKISLENSYVDIGA